MKPSHKNRLRILQLLSGEYGTGGEDQVGYFQRIEWERMHLSMILPWRLYKHTRSSLDTKICYVWLLGRTYQTGVESDE